MTEFQKQALDTLFSHFPNGLTICVPSKYSFKDTTNCGDLTPSEIYLVSKLFGIKPESFITLPINTMGNYHKFKNLKERNEWIERHYAETDVCTLQDRFTEEERDELNKYKKELSTYPDIYSDLDRDGRIFFLPVEERLSKFASEENLLFLKPWIKSLFMHYKHGKWMKTIKIFRVIEMIDLLLSNKKLVKVEEVPVLEFQNSKGLLIV